MMGTCRLELATLLLMVEFLFWHPAPQRGEQKCFSQLSVGDTPKGAPPWQDRRPNREAKLCGAEWRCVGFNVLVPSNRRFGKKTKQKPSTSNRSHVSIW
jgi:hypothetical protein